jgi:hypothetical protein
MKLAEVFSQLTSGELSQISIGSGPNGEITESNYRAVMTHVNLGLTMLYKRFNLKEGRLLLQLQDDQVMYILKSAYAVNGKRTTQPVRYIIDTTDAPFQDDILKVERVLTDAGYSLNLNDYTDQYSVMTPSDNVLRVPAEMVGPIALAPDYLKTSQLTLVYRANHPFIDTEVGSFDPENRDIELPYAYLPALLLFVASRVNNPIGVSGQYHAGDSYAAKFEQECRQLEAQNLEIDDVGTNTRAERNGWA